jgi:hypothetical protein|tara:strand:+ start:6302 stop:6493 length:192 start_codon:yes stop_codon:yes gene_type:complete
MVKKKKKYRNNIRYVEVISLKTRDIRTIDLKKDGIYFDEELETFQEIALGTSGSIYIDETIQD